MTSTNETVDVADHPPAEPASVADASRAEHRVVYKKQGVYACFPSLTVLGPETFATTFATRVNVSHIDTTGGSQTLISEDGGYTWREPTEPIVDPRSKTSWGARVELGGLGWSYVPAEQQAELEKQNRIIRPAQAGTIAVMGHQPCYRVSTDGGKSWDKHEIQVPDYVAGLMDYHARASELVAKDGLRLRATYGRRVEHADAGLEKRLELFFLRSDDDGRTWQFVPLLSEGLGDCPVAFNESAIIENQTGAIIAMMRTDPEGEGYLWQSVSHDRGLTWSRPEQTDIWGYPADLLRLDDGRILCVYGYRRDPMGVRAVWSEDDGKTWEIEKQVILRDDGATLGGNLGYPLSAQLPDGRICTLYYFTTSEGVTHVATTHWRVPA